MAPTSRHSKAVPQRQRQVLQPQSRIVTVYEETPRVQSSVNRHAQQHRAMHFLWPNGACKAPAPGGCSYSPQVLQHDAMGGYSRDCARQ